MRKLAKLSTVIVVLLGLGFSSDAQLVISDSLATVGTSNPLRSLYRLEHETTKGIRLNLPELKPLSLFCRLEYEEDSKGYVKKRFRLGTLDYTNYLEGKNQSYLLD